jgi:hypothetical protein
MDSAQLPAGEAFGFVSDLATKLSEHSQLIEVADTYSNADYGAKVNAAIATLGARGGIVYMLPTAEVEYSTTIVVTDGIRLIGAHNPKVESQASASWDTGTHLTYTGTGNAIEVFADDDAQHGGVTFENFLLECNNAGATGGIIFLGQHYRTVFKDIAIDGPGAGTSFIGIDIPLKDTGGSSTTSSWPIGYGVKLRNCNVGMQLEGVNALTWTAGTCIDCETGIHFLYNSDANGRCSGHTYLGQEVERVTTGFKIDHGTAITIIGGYYESPGVNDLYIDAASGTGPASAGEVRALTIIGAYMNSRTTGNHAIKITRVAELNIVGGYANQQATSVIDNDSTGGYDNHTVLNFVSNDVEIWNTTDGVNLTNNLAGKIIYPEMPTSAGVAGELWYDATDSNRVKMSV